MDFVTSILLHVFNVQQNLQHPDRPPSTEK